MGKQAIFAGLTVALTLSALVGCSAPAPETDRPAAQATGTGIDRSVLPIPEPDYPRETKLDAREAKAPPRFEVKPLSGAPNVIVFLIDDIGFGHASTFGGAIPMPTLDRLASQGLKYNRFHTTALCPPTRKVFRAHMLFFATASVLTWRCAEPGRKRSRSSRVTGISRRRSGTCT